MTHWGWYWKVKKRHIPKKLCDSLLCIDSFSLFKNKNFSGFTINNEKYPIKAVFQENEFIITTNSKNYCISVEKEACHFGGFRYFLRCPVSTCNRRMRKLYHYQNCIVCRCCLKLGYYSQRVTPCLRNRHMMNKVEDKLKRVGGTLQSKPKWMRKVTFEKLRDKYWKYDEKHEAAFCKESLELFGQVLF
jgi:hypothetical protein